MNTFNIGDKVRRVLTSNGRDGAKIGQVAVVVRDHGAGLVGVSYEGMYPDRHTKTMESWGRSYTELVTTTDEEDNMSNVEVCNKPHKHRDLIIAWANGAEIQVKLSDTDQWTSTDSPGWRIFGKYRIKPKTIKYKRFLCRFGDSLDVLLVTPDRQATEPRQTWDSFVKWIDNDWQEVEI